MKFVMPIAYLQASFGDLSLLKDESIYYLYKRHILFISMTCPNYLSKV